MLPVLDRKIRMENIGKSLRYDIPINIARKILLDLVLADHTYAKASSLDPEFNRIHSTSLLFTKPEDVDDDDTVIINIEEVEERKETKLIFDKDAGRKGMSELEECFKSLQEDGGWQEEDVITRIGWTRDQAKLFDHIYKIISTYRLARCSYEGHSNEQILRSLALDKAAKRFRNIAGGVAWDSKLMQWLHATLVNGINSYMFLCYLELLQNLKSKIPSLVDKMTSNSTIKPERSMVLDSPKITGCLSKAWEPTPRLKSARIKENNDGSPKETALENKPLVIMLPRGPCVSLKHPKRSKFWQNQLGNTGRVIQVNMLDVEKPEDFAASSFLENVIGGTRTKISLFKSQFPGKPVILIGWSVGALLSCQIATLESVAGIVCLGYPSCGLDGVREVENYNCLDIRCPVMFVIGTHSPVCSAEFIENLREKMRVDTKLLLVEGGDEVLKLTSSQKRRLQVTQSMVDRLIMDEIEAFINCILTKSDKPRDNSRPGTPTPSSQLLRAADKKRKIKRGVETEGSMIDKKKSRLSPAQQAKIQNRSKTKASSSQDANTGVNDGMMTPSELTMAASQNLPSNSSPLVSPRTLASKFKEQAIKDVGPNSQVSKLTVKSPHLKYAEKAMKKPKLSKEPRPVSRSLSTPPQQGISQADILAMQRFPTTSSILLSNSGAHLRLHDGRIVRVSSADASKTHHGTSQLSIATLKGQASISSKGIPASKDFSTNMRSALSSSTQSKLLSGFSNLADTPEAENFNKVGEASNTGAMSLSEAAAKSSISRSFSAPGAPASTQLSPNDLKYLTDLFNKGQVTIAPAPGYVDTPKQAESAQLVPDSPISAKIGIGTLTNLANLDGSPPRSGTRQSPGSGLKLTPPKEPRNAEKLDAKDQNEVLQPLNADTTPTAAHASTFVRKEINKGLSSTPVTITIPTYNTTNQGMAPIKAGSVLGSSNASRVAVAGSCHPTAKIAHSKSAMELSQLMRKVSGPSLPSTASASRLSVASSSTSPATLTVTSRQIQGTSRGVSSPQTITLHIPNSAMLKDHKNLKSTGSEIKFIGFLNQKGRSPMTSPIHFSVQSRSNPGSPKSQSPSVMFTSKSDPPSPNPVKLVKEKDKETESQPISKQPEVPNPVISVSMSSPRQPATPKNGNAGSKICKPTTIQTALIKSLTSVSFSAKQKESIANLLKSQNLMQGQELKGTNDVPNLPASVTSVSNVKSAATNPAGSKVTQTGTINTGTKLHGIGIGSKAATTLTTTANSRDLEGDKRTEKVTAVEDDSRGSISFVSDNSVTTIVKKGSDGQNEINGHNTVTRKAYDKEADIENVTQKNVESSGLVMTAKDGQMKPEHNSGVQSGINKTDFNASGETPGKIACASRPLQSDDLCKAVNSSQIKKQKRLRETGSLDIETACDEDTGPTVAKRITRRGMSGGDGKGSITNVQKTEE